MRIAAVCPSCGAALETRVCCEAFGPRCCWRCLRPIVVIEAAREPNAAELAAIDHEQLDLWRKRAIEYRESIRE